MRNRIAGIMHWEHVGIAHSSPQRPKSAMRIAKRKDAPPYKALAAATLLGVAIVLTLRAFFGAPSARA